MPAQGWLERLGRGKPHGHQERPRQRIRCADRRRRRDRPLLRLARRAARAQRLRAGARAGRLPARPTSRPGCSPRSARRRGARRACCASTSPRTRSGRASRRELERESGAASGFARTGALHVALDRDETEELRRRHELHREHGLESEWLAPSACRELEPGLAPSVAGGVLAPHEGAADPRQLSAALVAALAARGATLVEGAEVAEAEFGDEVSVTTTDGRELRGSDAGAGHRMLGRARRPGSPAEARPPVRPVKGEILTLRQRADQPVCERIVVGDRRLHGPARGRPAAGRGDGRGAGLRHHGHGRRRPRAAARGLPDPARGRRAGAGRGARRAATRQPGQRSPDRTRRERTAC